MIKEKIRNIFFFVNHFLSNFYENLFPSLKHAPTNSEKKLPKHPLEKEGFNSTLLAAPFDFCFFRES